MLEVSPNLCCSWQPVLLGKIDSTEFLSVDFVPTILFLFMELLMSMMVKLVLWVSLVGLIATERVGPQSLLKAGYSSFSC